jgi:hypothetical protein
MDDFLLFADNKDAALQLRDSVACLLDRLGLGRNPKKCHWESTQICEHLGLHIETTTSTFRAPASKLQAIATLSRTLLQHSTRDARWLPARQLAVLAGKVQYNTSPFHKADSTSANYTTSSLRAHDGEAECDSPTS